MPVTDRTLRPKLGLLQLAEKLGNVTRACQSLGYSRDSYYRFKALYQNGGTEALRNFTRRRPIPKNRVNTFTERAVVEHSIEHPQWGQQRIAQALSDKGVAISPSGVRNIWMRYGLETQEKRVFAILARSAQEGCALSDEQAVAVHVARSRGKLSSGRYIAAPGQVCFQDISLMIDHPRLGAIHQHTFVDGYSNLAFVRLITNHEPDGQVRFLEEEVLPWFQTRGLTIESIRTDRRPPFAEKDNGFAYQAALKRAGIRQTFRLTRGGRGDACEMVVSTLRREVYHPLARQVGLSVNEVVHAVAEWLKDYNQRPASGPYCYGKSPLKTIHDFLRHQTTSGSCSSADERGPAHEWQ
jgi:hypothetical protein